MGRITALSLALLLLTATGAVAAESYCFDEAGLRYGINPQILRAIAKVESNFNPGAINWNTNGSYDFGVMQINSIWAPTLGKERWNTLGDPCSNIKTGASILAGCMKKYGYTWEAIGCYNSQTPDKRDKYARSVFKQLQRLDKDDQRLKESMAAVVRNQLDTLVKADQNGQGGVLKMKVMAPVTVPVEIVKELATPPAGQQPPMPETQEAELRASSLFEGAVNGM
jgi:soluble lytic murein transglycosylase-like protein